MKSIVPAFLALTLVASPVLGASPNLRGMKPMGGQRGTEVELTITGQRLADAKEILFYQPGITVTKLEPASAEQVKATFKVEPDARLGLHDFRIRTATGVSRLKTFSVGALKDVVETEPNNDFAQPQPIALNVTVNGVAENEDVDYYSVQAKKGERITAEVEGIRLGLSLFDPYVAILDAKRFELASSDDAALIWQDGFASIVAPADGTYIVVVRESAYAGNANCLYRLHVGNFPRPTATVPAGGKLGESVTVRWIGDVLGETSSTLTLPASPDQSFALIAQDERGTAPYPNVFRLSPFGNAIEAEPNDAHKTATPFTPPIALNGVIEKEGDVDSFVFRATKGQTFDVRVFARQLRSPLDSVLTIAAKDGGALASNDDSGGPDSYVRFNAPNDGQFVISVADHLKKGGADYAYRIEVSPVSPRLTMSTPNESFRRGTATMAIAVPKGNRQAILINAGRTDFGGELTLAASGLPAGVAFEADTMSASTATIPVLFTATADAPVGSAMARVSGKPVDPKLEIPSAFASTSELVLGQNNVAFWTRTVDSLAVTVAEEAPFSIEVVAPKVPIVRGGSMDLKVVATRKPDFTAPIAVVLPWNPPGIASKSGVIIPEKQNEAVIPLNANNGAELRSWKIVVDGTAEIASGGRTTVSSELTPLTVAPQFLTMTYGAVSVEQGKEVDLPVKITKAVDFAGEAKVTLVGLPNKVTTDPKTITKDTTELVFHVKTDPASPAGETKNLFCQVVITQEGEPIVHNLGTGRLRIDTPLPQKAAAPTPAAAAAPKPAAAAKPLTRLEKLRLESQERAKAAAETNK